MTGFTRRAVLGAAAATLSAPGVLRAQQAQQIAIATGTTGGVYYPLGGGMASLMSRNIPGMSATVDVRVQDKTNVVVIPTRAIRTEGDRSFVRLQQNGQFVDREITTGVSNDFQTEVTSGIKEGDKIAARGTTQAPATDSGS